MHTWQDVLLPAVRPLVAVPACCAVAAPELPEAAGPAAAGGPPAPVEASQGALSSLSPCHEPQHRWEEAAAQKRPAPTAPSAVVAGETVVAGVPLLPHRLLPPLLPAGREQLALPLEVAAVHPPCPCQPQCPHQARHHRPHRSAAVQTSPRCPHPWRRCSSAAAWKTTRGTAWRRTLPVSLSYGPPLCLSGRTGESPQ